MYIFAGNLTTKIMVKEMTLGSAKAVSHTADEPIKWSAGMLEAFAQAKNGDWKVGDINNFWGNI